MRAARARPRHQKYRVVAKACVTTPLRHDLTAALALEKLRFEIRHRQRDHAHKPGLPRSRNAVEPAHISRQQAAAPAPEPASAPSAAPQPAARADELVRISAVRRQIAEHMVRSVSTSPHAWALREVDATRLVEYREAEKEAFRERHGFPLSYVPFFVQIVCEALLANPYL